MNNLSWSFSSVWNQSLEQSPQREIKPRANIWASEVGGAYIDRYLKMTGIKPSNPFNARTLRKFEAGRLAEWLVGMVLKRAGVAWQGQKWSSYRYPNLLEITGKADYLAGGKPDWEKAKAEVDSLGLPEFFGRATDNIVKHFAEKYPDGLKNIILEIKSCSGMMFEKYLKLGADPRHAAQSFHYLKADNMPEAHVVYFSKDDLRLLEIGVMNPSPVEEYYKEDIENISYYYTRSVQPRLEQEITFDELEGKFAANHKVKYSNYLTRLYNYKDQTEFETKYKPMVGKWNRTLGRCVNGDKMTPLNLETIVEIKKTFPKFDAVVETLKARGIKIEENGEEI